MGREGMSGSLRVEAVLSVINFKHGTEKDYDKVIFIERKHCEWKQEEREAEEDAKRKKECRQMQRSE